ncbi:MAG: hypothetical protein COB71_11905 [Thiotrichales bacterium]|nr:MAG: hypothetical protein COB71_11905 [Thiotrichales bacterium]
MALVVLAVIAPFYLKNQQGVPLISINDIKMPSLSTPAIPDGVKSAVAAISSNIPTSERMANAQEKAQIKVHKWRDKDGVWHFSNIDTSRPGINSTVVLLNPGKNTFTPSPTQQPQRETTSMKTTQVENITPNIFLPLTHGKAAMDQAKQVQKRLEQRSQMQQQMMP